MLLIHKKVLSLRLVIKHHCEYSITNRIKILKLFNGQEKVKLLIHHCGPGGLGVEETVCLY